MSQAETTRTGLEGIAPDRAATTGSAGGRQRGRRRGRRGDPHAMVPPAEFTSYYGRPVVKAAPWTNDIPAYLFLGGLASASSVLAACADLTGRPVLAQGGRLTALGAISLSGYCLIHDLGRPSRFHHMLRVAKPTSPMSVGTWVLTAYGPFAGLAAIAELPALWPRIVRPLAPLAGRAAGLIAAVVAPAVATYTAVLLGDTATPAWKEAAPYLPFVFAAGAAASAGGMGLIAAPAHEVAPAQRLAVVAALTEVGAVHVMEHKMGLSAETRHTGRPGFINRLAQAFLLTGAVLTVAGRRSRPVSIVAGLCLLSGAASTRFATFEAGQASARDPRYTVVPQRERLDRNKPATS